MSIDIAKVCSGTYFKEFDGYSHIVTINGAPILLYDILTVGIKGYILSDEYECTCISGYRRETILYKVRFEDCEIILKIKAPDADENNPIMIVNKDDKIRYNCLRIDFAPKKYTFIFENTDTGEKGDVTIDITSYDGNVSTLLAYN